ncbi:phage antirepressor KilAC domain-containing protein [Paracandidimonas soli]|uniref:KilA domain-containing protein n=1 Tax=Paracandidimonas soli TaxID=1917182 RepID=A0A4R3UJ25_9BURK|nr:phage antirepressor KilAC domain-containing protein [Paracandidimonas soli]TCU91636.1 KilA domain-containing protein [Paracandidimonas soli]
MSNIITIADVAIRQDDQGRYSLNDLHRAAGGESKHQPANWLRMQQTQELTAHIEAEAIPHFRGIESKQGLGTFVCKELVYAYAMWISPAFHLKVIRAYDQMRAQPQRDPMEVLNDPAAMRGLLLGYSEKVLALESKVQEQAPKVEVFERIADAAGSMTLRETATTLKYPERKMILWMQQKGWLYRRPGRGTLLGYAERIKSGHLEHKLTLIHNERTGEDETRESVRVTPLGLTVLAQKLGCEVSAADVPAGVMVMSAPRNYAERRT